MTVPFSEITNNVDSLLTSLTVLFPGLVAYFLYIGIRTTEFEEIKRSHVVLILVFTLFFQIIRELSGDLMANGLFAGFYFFVLPVLLGVVADISHRLFVTTGVEWYQNSIVDKHQRLKLIDVGNVSRWQKTIKSFIGDSLGDVTNDYFAEIEVDTSAETIRGFLNGYSKDGIELIRYEDLTEMDFSNVGEPDIDEEQLTARIEIVPREKITSLKIYRVKMEDFRLQ